MRLRPIRARFRLTPDVGSIVPGDNCHLPSLSLTQLSNILSAMGSLGSFSNNNIIAELIGTMNYSQRLCRPPTLGVLT